ncbi:MAG: hypothetical protein KDE27_08050 [Planctomycetes bacterium]|nr:hypothetical protein [Planctomycetota bacterium]
MPPPEALANRPNLDKEQIPIWNCWHALDATRDTGFVGGLRLSMAECFDIFGVPERDRPRWMRLLLAMEGVYRKFMAAKVKQPEEGDGESRAAD